jgi:hypothetical protein
MHPAYIEHRDGEGNEGRRRRAMELLYPSVVAIVPETKPAKLDKEPCQFYHAIRGFYAAAQSAGMNVKANARMRQALSCFLGREIISRKELAAQEWERATTAVSIGELIW